MDPQADTPANLYERLILLAMLATYPAWLVGGLYILAPVLGWIMAGLLVLRLLSGTGPMPRIPLPVWLWLLGMMGMLVALLVGHVDFNLGPAQTIKSAIGWAKGWALLGLFILIGTLPIRASIIYRGACVVGMQTLCLLPLFVGAWLLGLPQTLYVSPLQAIGGPGPEFFAVSLYEIDPGSGLPRWRLFTPWAPAAGMMGNLYFLFALQETNRRWRWLGVLGALAMVLMSQSRLALVALVFVAALGWWLPRALQPRLLMLGSVVAAVAGLLANAVLRFAEDFWQAFRSARADSTRVRETLARIAVERWQSEAPVWGHGIVERGPHLVEYMPIGSHHTWLGLLFVKGIVGLAALAVPMTLGLIDLLLRAGCCALARCAIGAMVVLWLYTFGENLEILAYLFWPALVVIGAAHAAPYRHVEQATPATSPSSHAMERFSCP